MADNGYRYTVEALSGVVDTLRGAAAGLDHASGAPITAPDAGATSDAVGTALGGLLKAAVTAAHEIDTTAGKVHASKGSYADVENGNEGELRREHQAGLSDSTNLPLN
jgi:hypothetical protein